MQRRKVLMGSAVATSIVIAGCSSSDPDYEGGDDGDDDSSDDEPDADDITIVEHNMHAEQGEFMDDVTVEGIVENNSGEMADYVQVSVRVYDEDDNQLDSYLDNTTDLDDGATWSFEVMVLEDAEDVDSYDVAVEDTTF